MNHTSARTYTRYFVAAIMKLLRGMLLFCVFDGVSEVMAAEDVFRYALRLAMSTYES